MEYNLIITQSQRTKYIVKKKNKNKVNTYIYKMLSTKKAGQWRRKKSERQETECGGKNPIF